jgi:predicted nucleic acid-binding protein
VIVVSDTSPIRALHFLGLLPILGRLYGQVVVPTAVQKELFLARALLKRVDVSQCDFVEVRAPSDPPQVNEFLQSLHRGESEALALALELHADALLIDELAGRQIAKEIGVRHSVRSVFCWRRKRTGSYQKFGR